jgi:hypothetical protein
VLLGVWLLVAVCGLIWAAAWLAAGITGGTTEPFGIKFAVDVVHGRTGQAWPHTPTVAVAVAAALLTLGIAALVISVAWVVARWRPAPGDPVAALARNPRMRALTHRVAARAAAGLRPPDALRRADEPARTAPEAAIHRCHHQRLRTCGTHKNASGMAIGRSLR